MMMTNIWAIQLPMNGLFCNFTFECTNCGSYTIINTLLGWLLDAKLISIHPLHWSIFYNWKLQWNELQEHGKIHMDPDS